MNKTTDKLTQKLKEIFKDRLVSLILYGSCVTNDCDNEFSDINTIVVIDSLSAIDLKNSSTAVKEFAKTIKSTNPKKFASITYLIELLSEYMTAHCNPSAVIKNPLPLFMGRDEWFNSCDVYPIEYSDIKARYKILYGEDVVAPLVLEKSNLRLQCEYEVKNLLIKLRQNYLVKSHDLNEIEKLLKRSSKSFFALFRAILRITETDVPFNHRKVIDLLSDKIKINKPTFLELLDLRTNPKAILRDEYEDTIQKLINSGEEILKYVDKI